MKGTRILAYLIDLVVIGIVASIVCAIAGLKISVLWSSGAFKVISDPVSVIYSITYLLYFLTDVLFGGSAGKKILGLDVTAAAPGFGTALLRSFVKLVSISLLFGIIIFLMGDGSTSFHDKIARTKVTRTVAVA